MLSDEEKKALKELTEIKELVEEDLKYKDYEVAATLDQIDLESLVIVLNLIEKQFKEIEELKNADLTTVYLNGFYDGEKKVKDKIKAKIEEYKKDGKIINQTMPYCGEYINHFEIKALQSLLEKE